MMLRRDTFRLQTGLQEYVPLLNIVAVFAFVTDTSSRNTFMSSSSLSADGTCTTTSYIDTPIIPI